MGQFKFIIVFLFLTVVLPGKTVTYDVMSNLEIAKVAVNSVTTKTIEIKNRDDFKNILKRLSLNVEKFKDNLPVLSGVIKSLPRAGTLGIKLDNFRVIDSGFKLKTKKGGVFYLRKNKNGKLEAKYLRSEVGKFEIGDKFNSNWYKPVFVLGNFVDKNENNNEVFKLLKSNLLNKLSKMEGVRVIANSKTDKVVSKLTDLNRRKILRRLYGVGIDYLIESNMNKDTNGYFIEFKIFSNYSGKLLLKEKINI